MKPATLDSEILCHSMQILHGIGNADQMSMIVYEVSHLPPNLEFRTRRTPNSNDRRRLTTDTYILFYMLRRLSCRDLILGI